MNILDEYKIVGFQIHQELGFVELTLKKGDREFYPPIEVRFPNFFECLFGVTLKSKIQNAIIERARYEDYLTQDEMITRQKVYEAIGWGEKK